MDEQVLAGFIGRDEAVALVVAEPFDGSGCHLFPPGRSCAAKRGRCESNHYERWHWFAGRNTRHVESKRSCRGPAIAVGRALGRGGSGARSGRALDTT